MLLDASHVNCISSNIPGNLYCTVYRMNGCKEGMLRLRFLDHAIDRMHKVPGLPKFAT